MSRPRKLRTHAPEGVWRHLLARYGACPEDIAEEIVRRVSERTWAPPRRVDEALEIVLTSLVRHRLTDYERLLEVDGLTREEARLIVAPEVNAITGSWKT